MLCQAVSPLNNYLNDCNRQSILGRIVRVTDEVIEYRNWIKKTFEQRLITREVILATDPSSKYHQQTGQQIIQVSANADGHGFRRSSISSDDISESDESDDQDNLSNKSRDEISPTNHHQMMTPNMGQKKFVQPVVQTKVFSPHQRAQQREKQQREREREALEQQMNNNNSNVLLIDSNDTFPPLQ